MEPAGFFETFKRFLFPKEQVLDHWYVPLDHFGYPTSDFYALVETALKERKVPGLTSTRVELSEGGLLSAKREYLRLTRERLVFDICASPFGTSYFFSVRFVELPLGIKALDMLVLVVGFAILASLLTNVFGFIWGCLALFAILAAGIWTMRNAMRLGFTDLDAVLLKTPVISPVYEILFRKETYYREDTRLMYVSTVDTIAKALVDEVTAAKGIKLVRRYERRSGMSDLYRESAHVPDAKPPAPEKAV